jgi:hypothetical protein
MAAAFWDRKGALTVKFMLQGPTVTSEVYCKTLKKLHKVGHSVSKAWNADALCSAPTWQRMSTYSCSHWSTTGAFQLGVVWPPSLQLWSHSEWLSPVYLREELVGITALQQ